jgi:hypothetical protein
MNREQTVSAERSARSMNDSAWGLAPPRPLNNLGTRADGRGDLNCGCELFAFHDLPRREGIRPVTLRGPLHIQCNAYGDPQHLDELTTTVLGWPYVETNLPDKNSSNTIPLRLEETASGYNFAAFISPREFGRVLIGAPTIYLALPLLCAHWAIVRGWAEPHYLSSYGLMPPGALVVYTPRDRHELSICYSLFLAAYTAASKLSTGPGTSNKGQ